MRWSLVVLILMFTPSLCLEAREEVGDAPIAELVASLTSDDASDRRVAREALLGPLLFDLPRAAVFSEAARPSIAHVRRALRSGDPITRVLGAAAASRMGLFARPVLGELVSGLANGEFAYDFQALEAIRKLGPEAAAAAPALAEAVHTYADYSLGGTREGVDPEALRDAGAANLAALRAIGPEGLAALRASVSNRSYVRPLTTAGLRWLEACLDPQPPDVETPAPDPQPGPTPDAWLARLEAETAAHGVPGWAPPFRGSNGPTWPDHMALFALGESGVPALTHAIKTGSAEVRATAIAMLEGLGERARAAGPALFDIIAADSSLARAALEALGAGGSNDVAWLDTLLLFLEGDIRTVPLGAVLTIGRMGSAAESARDPLLALLSATPARDVAGADLKPRDAASSDAVVRALGSIGGPPDVLVPALLDVGARGWVHRPPGVPHGGHRGPPWRRPTDRRFAIRDSAAEALGMLGLPALPRVRAALRSEEAGVRATAARALAHFPAAAVGESAVFASRDDDAAVRRAALPALGEQGDGPALRALMVLLGDSDASIVAATIATLAELGGLAEAAAPSLGALIVGRTSHARQALEALDRIRPDAETMWAPILVDAVVAGALPPAQLTWRLHRLGHGLGPSSTKLIKALERMEDADRVATLALLTDHAGRDPAFHAALRRDAVHPSVVVRRAAVSALGSVIPAGAVPHEAPYRAASVKALIDALADPDLQVARSAASSLRGLAAEEPGVRAAMRGHLGDGREAIQAIAAEVVASGDDAQDAAPAAVALLESGDEHVRASALQTIAAIGDMATVLPRLLRMFEEETAHGVRIRLLGAIASTGPDGVEFVRRQLRTLGGNESAWFMARAALRHGRGHVVPELRSWLRSNDLATYAAAAMMLRDMGAPAAAPAVPELFALADSGHRQALAQATEALFAILGPDPRVVDLIDRCLRADVTTRNMATRLLARMGASVADVLPGVMRALPRLHGNLLEEALDGLSSLGAKGTSAIPAVMASVPGADAYERAMCLETLGRLAAFDRAPRAALRWGVDDPDAHVRRVAAAALIAQFRSDASTIEFVGRLLHDPDADVRQSVAEALGAIGADATPALPSLLRAVETDGGAPMRSAFDALAKLERGSPAVRPVLMRLARGRDPWRARAALKALGRVPGEDAEVDALLLASGASWDWRVQLGAREGRALRASR